MSDVEMTSLSFEEQADALLACGAATDAARLREALRSAGVREWPDRSVVSPSRERSCRLRGPRSA